MVGSPGFIHRSTLLVTTFVLVPLIRVSKRHTTGRLTDSLTSSEQHIQTQRVTKRRGRHCGDVELTAYLANSEDPVSLVLDLRIVHDRFGSTSDLNLNGHLHYPNDIDKSLNDTVTDKIRTYRSEYNNIPPTVVAFIPVIVSTSGRLHSEFVRLLFLAWCSVCRLK